MKKLVLIMAFLPFLVSCEKEKGCMDKKSLNYKASAEIDDGSCDYSTVTFYAKYGFFNGIPITKVDVTIDGSAIGSVTSFFQNGPGNCSAVGTVSYKFQSHESVDWNSIVYLSTGATLLGSGTISPNSSQECIKVNVTN